MEMTPKELKLICRKLNLYSTPFVNDVLYAHYKGFKKIDALQEYTGLKVLYLEGNGFDKIEGLEKCKILRCLYLQENLIKKIENLEDLEDLDSLNLSQNMIKKIENLHANAKLNTLLLQKNKITTIEDLQGVTECKHLSVLDLSNNFIDDPSFIDVLSQLPTLKVLYMKGNPVVKKVKQYRKTIIARIKTLTYLDDRPVFEDERRTAEAWFEGGKEGEAKERDTIAFEKKEKERKQFEWFGSIMAKGRAEKLAKDKKKAEEFDAEVARAKEAEKARIALINEELKSSEPKIIQKVQETSNKGIQIIEDDYICDEEKSKIADESSEASEESIQDEKVASTDGSEDDDVPTLEAVPEAVGRSLANHPCLAETASHSEEYLQEEKRRSSTDEEEYIKAEEKRVSSQEASEEEQEEEVREVKEAFGVTDKSASVFVTQQAQEQEDLVVEEFEEEEGLPPMPELEVMDGDCVVNVVDDEGSHPVDEIDELD